MQHSHLTELKALNTQLQFNAGGIYFRQQQYDLLETQASGRLAAMLYAECYAKKKYFQTHPAPALPEDLSFINQLSENNHSTGYTDAGWAIQHILPDARMVVYKNNAQQLIETSQLLRHTAAIPNVGEIATVKFPEESRTLQQGFYYVHSNTPFDGSGQLLRIYWNITREGAPALVSILTQLLNHYHIPFMFKCLDHADQYIRRDSSVLYLSYQYYNFLSRLMPAIHTSVSTYLHDDVPLFTCRLNAGTGIAESPVNNESFGLHRMTILSNALLTCFREQINTPAKRMKKISEHFAQQGIDLQTPYLNKGSKFIFN